MKINKITKKIKVTENDFKDFSSIATIPEHFEKSMVLYITTWQEVPDDNQKDTMTTKPKWFIEFENKQKQCWKEQQEFNKKQEEFNQKVVKRLDGQDKLIQQILSLVQSMINRVENIEHRLDKLESRIDNLVAKNNLKQ